MYLVQVSLLLIGQQVWDISSGIGPCFPLTGGLCKFYANAERKQPIQRQLLLVQYRQQANPLVSIHNYTPLVISRNDKKAANIHNCVQQSEQHRYLLELYAAGLIHCRVDSGCTGFEVCWRCCMRRRFRELSSRPHWPPSQRGHACTSCSERYVSNLRL